MDNNVYSDELQHWGIKGQRWGQRRYQNKDGTLTDAGKKRYNKEVEKLKEEEKKIKAAEKVASNKQKTQTKIDKLDAKKQELEERKKALKGKKPGESDETNETPEQRREKALKSDDPAEILRNKDLLTNQELQERVNRINLENQLQSKIVQEQKKSGLDYMDSAANAINKTTNLYRSVDNAYNTVANSSIGKMVAKQLGIETPKKEFNLAEALKNRNKMSTQELMDLNKRMMTDDLIDQRLANRKKAEDDAKAIKDKEAAAKKAQKDVEDYNERWRKGESDDKVTADREFTTESYSNPYSKKGSDLSNARDDTRVVKDYPAVISSTSLSTVTSTPVYSSGRDYVNSNASKVSATRVKNKDVDIIEPEWYTKMKRNGQL